MGGQTDWKISIWKHTLCASQWCIYNDTIPFREKKPTKRIELVNYWSSIDLWSRFSLHAWQTVDRVSLGATDFHDCIFLEMRFRSLADFIADFEKHKLVWQILWFRCATVVAAHHTRIDSNYCSNYSKDDLTLLLKTLREIFFNLHFFTNKL